MYKRQVIIGAAIIDVLAYPVNVKVFETGSYSTEDIHMTTGADALNEATILAKKGRRVQLETVIGQDDAGKFIQAHCDDAGIMVRDACIKKDEKTGRMMMVPVEGSEKEIPADLVLIAAGFLGSEAYVTEAFGVKVNQRTNVETKPDSFATNVENVFTAGDMHRGQSLVVWAIREGRDAAREVDKQLMGYTNL